MFNRRMFVAVALCFAVSATSAFAGGNGGTKKNATIQVKNQSGIPVVYVIVDKTPEQILAAVQAQPNVDPAVVLGSLGKAINNGNTHDFKVKTGPHRVVAIDLERFDELAPLNAVILNQTVNANTQSATVVVVNAPPVLN